MDFFPRGEVGSAEIGFFEVASENGIYSVGALSSIGQGAASMVGAAVAATVLTSAGQGACSPIGAALFTATFTAAATAATTLQGSALRQGAMTSSGSAALALEGITFQPNLTLGDDFMNRNTEARAMAKPAENRAMTEPVDSGIDRDAEQRGMTK